VFDQHIQSIGAVAIDKAKPETVWAGTGESCVRNSVSVGDGVYKTTDGGTWTNMGLADTERIARIAIDPKKSDTVFVCATGTRGTRTKSAASSATDGGKTWKKVLYVDANTGCSDLSMDPGSRRSSTPACSSGASRTFFTSGAEAVLPQYGWRRNVDEAEERPPTGHLDASPSRSRRRDQARYTRSSSRKDRAVPFDDLGQNWREVNDSFNVQVRPFYFAHIVVDPATTTASQTGPHAHVQRGRRQDLLGSRRRPVHPDHHARDSSEGPSMMIAGTDGGAYQSFDRANAGGTSTSCRSRSSIT
jgi:hypothetical protein